MLALKLTSNSFCEGLDKHKTTLLSIRKTTQELHPDETPDRQVSRIMWTQIEWIQCHYQTIMELREEFTTAQVCDIFTIDRISTDYSLAYEGSPQRIIFEASVESWPDLGGSVHLQQSTYAGRDEPCISFGVSRLDRGVIEGNG